MPTVLARLVMVHPEIEPVLPEAIMNVKSKSEHIPKSLNLGSK